MFGRSIRHHGRDSIYDSLSIDGQLAVDEIGRYESLASDFKRIFYFLDPKIELRRERVKRVTKDKLELTEQEKALIRKIYIKDFEFFGYE